ncbi:aldo/keto reductase [Oceanispirochaeta sp.]|uniref:aldo/keto reductase n=1 Tax=Oceanispirochaeta sp. TaxID=2035350 RepID=UPI00261EB47F|nr:aldo/keto reductase [Oceanispirochaeta sp.]MDA3958937.1 aldo/keto reductase [Oceanispirochaeta sp.]
MNKRYTLKNGYSFSRIINGGWQLSEGHALKSEIERKDVVKAFHELVARGFTTFDCADIYTGVEEFYGSFLKEHLAAGGHREDLQFHSKFVPDRAGLSELKPKNIREIIHRTLKRLGVDQVDMIQFHWWEYDIPGYLEALFELQKMQKEGKISQVSLTNFDTIRTKEIVEAGILIASMQAQYSLFDRRVEKGMQEYCKENDIALLCYGTLAGGFLTDQWIGKNEPDELDNRSLVKYRIIIDDFGGWSTYQELLILLKKLSSRYSCQIANICSAYILQKDAVGAVIIGTRNSRHIEGNSATLDLRLELEDVKAIDAFLADKPGPQGEPFELERNENGPHVKVMLRNLNQNK